MPCIGFSSSFARSMHDGGYEGRQARRATLTGSNGMGAVLTEIRRPATWRPVVAGPGSGARSVQCRTGTIERHLQDRPGTGCARR